MYEKIKDINAQTFLAVDNLRFYVLKSINADEIEIYKKLRSIHHQSLAKVVETVVYENSLYAVLKYVDGITLREYVEQSGALDDETAKDIAIQICEGLSVLHGNSIIHRDINPNNIIITDDGKAVIIDFGICRFEKDNQGCDTQILGTHGYAAPEQYGFHQTSEKSDIYSLGVLLNFMKTGHLPSEEKCTGSFSKIIEKCTEIDENNRYQSVYQLKSELLNGYEKPKSKASNVLKVVLYSFLYTLTGLVAFAASSNEKSITGKFFTILVFFFLIIVPCWIIANAFNWQKKFGISSLNKQMRSVLKTALCFISIIVSIVCILFV